MFATREQNSREMDKESFYLILEQAYARTHL